jgi:hypothetical protein
VCRPDNQGRACEPNENCLTEGVHPKGLCPILCPPYFKRPHFRSQPGIRRIAAICAGNQRDHHTSLSISIFRTHNPLVVGWNPSGPTFSLTAPVVPSPPVSLCSTLCALAGKNWPAHVRALESRPVRHRAGVSEESEWCRNAEKAQRPTIVFPKMLSSLLTEGMGTPVNRRHTFQLMRFSRAIAGQLCDCVMLTANCGR